MTRPPSLVDLTRRPARDPITETLHPGRPTNASSVSSRRTGPAFVVATLVLVVATVALRLWHQSSAYELFIDEIQYADVADSFAAGGGPQLFNAPFFLHPPLFFWFLSWFVGRPVGHMTVDFVLALRPVVLLFAAANVALVVAVARRVVAPWAALLAGVVYALDPFVIRFDSRVMLEAPAMTAVLAGVFAALVAVDRDDAMVRRAWLVVAGLAFGVAITTKSTAALITAVPLLLMIATSWGLRRREATGVLALQCSVYVGYVFWVLSRGQIGFWYEQTLAGTFRAIGLVKETGFTSAGGPSFTGRLLSQLELFAPSYLLIGVASCYAAYLLLIGFRSLRVGGRRGAHALRGDGAALGLLTCWLAGVLVAIVYTFGLGEVEEQTFYLLAVPATVVVALLATQMASWRRTTRVALVIVVTVGLVGSGAIWWALHSRPDDTYRQLVAYMSSNVGQSSSVALGEATAQFVLPGYDLHPMTSINDAQRRTSRYALVSTELSELGLAPASAAVVDELDRRYTPVFTAQGRTTGELRLYDLGRALAPGPAVPAPPR